MSTGGWDQHGDVLAELDELQRERWALTDEKRTDDSRQVKAARARRWAELYEREACLWRRVTDAQPAHDLLSRAACRAEIGARMEIRAWHNLAERFERPTVHDTAGRPAA